MYLVKTEKIPSSHFLNSFNDFSELTICSCCACLKVIFWALCCVLLSFINDWVHDWPLNITRKGKYFSYKQEKEAEVLVNIKTILKWLCIIWLVLNAWTETFPHTAKRKWKSMYVNWSPNSRKLSSGQDSLTCVAKACFSGAVHW